MKSYNPLQVFLDSHWKHLDDKIKNKYSLKSDLLLGNSKTADIAIVLKESPTDILALGMYYNEIKIPTEELRHEYIDKLTFMGSGTKANIWFYFDNNSIILNDLKWIRPYDELIKDIKDLLERMTIN